MKLNKKLETCTRGLRKARRASLAAIKAQVADGVLLAADEQIAARDVQIVDLNIKLAMCDIKRVARLEATDELIAALKAVIVIRGEQIGVVNTRARQLGGDPEALRQCSQEELQRLSEDNELARDRIKSALTRTRTAA